MILIKSRTGGRPENQDFYGTARTKYGKLIVVCDGMGGHKGGRHAAEIGVHSIIKEVTKSNFENPVIALQAAIQGANALIWQESNSYPNYKGMGTTVAVLLLTPKKAICCHVGDSRIYQLRDGNIIHRTFDHSHVFEMVSAGLITEEQARLSEKSNIITRALGISSTVEIDIADNLSYFKGDRFLLCTDGIWGVVPEKELVEMVNQKLDVETTVNQLVDKIDSLGFSNGGKHDNLTAALIEMESNSESLKNKEPLKKKDKRNILIFLVLILLTVSLSLSFYLLNKEKNAAQPVIKTRIIQNGIK